MRKLLKTVHRFDDVTVTSNIDLTASTVQHEIEKDVFEYEFRLAWEEEQAKAPDAKVVLVWSIPCVDVQYMWHPGCRARRVLDADWRLQTESMLTNSAPMALLFNGEDLNTFTFATDEVKKASSVRFGVDDDTNTIAGDIELGLKQFVGRNSTRLLVRADFRRIPYYKAVDDVRIWWEKVLKLEPMAVPAAARHPMYIYLLDQAMKMEKIGLISTNLAEKIALTVSPPDIERSESTEKRRERERIRRSDHPPYAIVGCNANSIKKSVYESVQLKIDLI